MRTSPTSRYIQNIIYPSLPWYRKFGKFIVLEQQQTVATAVFNSEINKVNAKMT
jgi:hypothetical protein